MNSDEREERLKQIRERRKGITPGEWTTSRILSMTIPPSGKVVLFHAFQELGAFEEIPIAECVATVPGEVRDVGGGFGSYPATRNAEFIANAPGDIDFFFSLLDSQAAHARELAMIVEVGTGDDPGTALSKRPPTITTAVNHLLKVIDYIAGFSDIEMREIVTRVVAHIDEEQRPALHRFYSALEAKAKEGERDG